MERLESDPPKKKTRRASTTSGKKKQQPFFDDAFLEDEKDIVERKKEKDKRVLDMLNDMQRTRYYYYLEYKERLVDKVEKQREQLQKQRELDEKRSQAREARKAQMAHKLKKRLESVPPKHNSSFLKDIPKTDFYHIVQEEHNLKRLGVLKSHADFEEFWSASLGRDPYGEGLLQQEEEAEDDEGRDEATDLPNPLDRITEEGSRPSTRKVDNRTGKQYQKHLETLFPKMELPRLHIFDMDLSQKVDEEEERRLHELRARMQKRLERRQVQNRMFTLALTHQATTKRILEDRMDETSQLMFQREFTNLGDLVYRRPLKYPEEEDPRHPLALNYAQNLDDFRTPSGAQSPPSRNAEEAIFDSVPDDVGPADSRPMSVKQPPIPLTMKELESTLPSMTSTRLSCMWRPSAALEPISMLEPLLSPPRPLSVGSGASIKSSKDNDEVAKNSEENNEMGKISEENDEVAKNSEENDEVAKNSEENAEMGKINEENDEVERKSEENDEVDRKNEENEEKDENSEENAIKSSEENGQT